MNRFLSSDRYSVSADSFISYAWAMKHAYADTDSRYLSICRRIWPVCGKGHNRGVNAWSASNMKVYEYQVFNKHNKKDWPYGDGASKSVSLIISSLRRQLCRALHAMQLSVAEAGSEIWSEMYSITACERGFPYQVSGISVSLSADKSPDDSVW